ncbi:transcriptional repressor [Lichenicoccus sp.]|uniref:transcriptional repressor n=1 Tax=Lichenicoccus sp. TaxID=2781899 RepID=UPI003D0AF5F3
MSTALFSPSTDRKLQAAESICAARGTRMTNLRRQVLGLVLETATPSSAYDLLDRLRVSHKGAAPPTIYRALDFLLEQGLVHKVERLSAYIGCVHSQDAEHHAAQFLICRQCGRVVELEDSAIAAACAAAARRLGFRTQGSTIEIEGLCAACQAAPTLDAPTLDAPV